MLPTPISQDNVVRGIFCARPPSWFMSRVPAACCTRAGRQEQPAFEESVIEAMQQAGGDGQRRADADAHHHVADLAHGREGQHALQIGLHHGVHHAHGHGDGAHPHQALAPRARATRQSCACARPDRRRPLHSRPRAAARSPESARPWPRESRCAAGTCTRLGHQRHQHQHKNAAGESCAPRPDRSTVRCPCGDR